MSEDWQIPEGMVESLLTPDPCADARFNAYLDGVDAGMEHVGGIMMELIKNLRAYGEDWPESTDLWEVPASVVLSLADNYEEKLRSALK